MRSVPFWWHSIDLGEGVVSPGLPSLADMQGYLDRLQLPDLRGKTVLDVGAWDGFYSCAAERRGARRVVALDHWVWSLAHGPPRPAALDRAQSPRRGGQG